MTHQLGYLNEEALAEARAAGMTAEEGAEALVAASRVILSLLAGKDWGAPEAEK